MVRAAIVVTALAGAAAGCAAGTCPTCPTASLTANGSTELTSKVGDMIAYAWESTNADSAASTVTITPSPDTCGNRTGPWVVTTLQGTTDPLSLLACQSGFTYVLEMTVTQAASDMTASSIVTIVVD